MQLNHVAGSRTRVQPVYNLGYDGQRTWVHLPEPNQGVITGVRGDPANRHQPACIPAKNARRVTLESLRRGQFPGIVPRPEARLGITESGHPRLRRHPRTGEHQHPTGTLEQLRRLE